MEIGSYDAFLECFNDFLTSSYDPDEDADGLSYDAVCEIAQMDSATWKQLERLLPWGQKNAEPTLLIKNLSVNDLVGTWSLDSGSLHLGKDQQADCLALWRGEKQIRILKILN
jgi:single-stranded DNA-specific DHH superfamily exonuclease